MWKNFRVPFLLTEIQAEKNFLAAHEEKTWYCFLGKFYKKYKSLRIQNDTNSRPLNEIEVNSLGKLC